MNEEEKVDFIWKKVAPKTLEKNENKLEKHEYKLFLKTHKSNSLFNREVEWWWRIWI